MPYIILCAHSLILLQGTFNNFGIITSFTFKTHPQTEVYGGLIQIDGEYFDDLTQAIADFSVNNTDGKASILPAYQYSNGKAYATITVFYDAPEAPADAFFGMLDIPRTYSDMSTRSYYDLLEAQTPIAPIAAGVTAKFASVNVLQYTPSLLATFRNLTTVSPLRYPPHVSIAHIAHSPTAPRSPPMTRPSSAPSTLSPSPRRSTRLAQTLPTHPTVRALSAPATSSSTSPTPRCTTSSTRSRTRLRISFVLLLTLRARMSARRSSIRTMGLRSLRLSSFGQGMLRGCRISRRRWTRIMLWVLPGATRSKPYS